MVLTGSNVRADKAKKIGLVDLLVNPLGKQCGCVYFICNTDSFMTMDINCDVLFYNRPRYKES